MTRYTSAGIVTFCLGIPALYALSAGPVVYLKASDRLFLDNQGFETIYYPLVVAEHHIPPFGDLMHRYIELWNCDHDQELTPTDLGAESSEQSAS
ncbi:hypothetical protein ETAA8_17990 [Anatilimnocola aggregata]|uniref:Uncharacterized protein n=1 Tax=Anatilimnocola aggregata TaxID=2528021 RepID=A0A517Y904_9BACT|nr:hypothetical protein ETAA8_17990 [Anatilimnocola aggregata]